MTRWRIGIALVLGPVLAAAGGCALPVTVPMAPLMGEAGPEDGANLGPDPMAAAVEEDGVAKRLGSELWTVVRPAIARAVEYGEDGQTFAWQSRSGDSGSVETVYAYFGEDGDVCRRLAITAQSPQDSDSFFAEACRSDANLWRVRPSAGEA